MTNAGALFQLSKLLPIEERIELLNLLNDDLNFSVVLKKENREETAYDVYGGRSFKLFV